MQSLNVVAIIPARGGSKRIPMKNIAPLCGRPLIEYTIKAALASGVCNRILISTDNEDIKMVSTIAGVEVIDRPVALAKDCASTESVLLHVLDKLAEHGHFPEWVMTLPPTSPFRGPDIIRQAVSMAASEPEAQDCLLTVTENRGDYWLGKPHDQLNRLFPKAPRRQQDREPLWEENSALYLSRVDSVRQTGSILGTKVRGLPISGFQGWDINTPLDLRMAEALIENEGIESVMGLKFLD